MSPPPEFLTPPFSMSCSGDAKNTAPMAAKKQSTVMAFPRSDDHERTMFCVMPNVRAKLAPTVRRQGQGGENVQGTAGLALVTRRWGSA